MDERSKAEEVGLIECQTCKKINLSSKQNVKYNFSEFFSMNLIILYMFELGLINLNFFVR